MKNSCIVVCLLCFFVAIPAMADMRVMLQDGIYGTTNGGEFLITVLNTIDGGGDQVGIYDVGGTFTTFCLETNEYVSYNSKYYVTIDTAAWYGGSGGSMPDPLSPESAYLYSLWLDGTDGVNTITYDTATTDAFQKAIWYLEQESLGSNTGLSAIYIAWAQDAVTLGGGNDSWYNTWGYTIGDIRVMNLWNDQNCTSRAQDQLVRVPIPGAVLLGILGLGAAGLKLRKFA